MVDRYAYGNYTETPHTSPPEILASARLASDVLCAGVKKFIKNFPRMEEACTDTDTSLFPWCVKHWQPPRWLQVNQLNALA